MAESFEFPQSIEPYQIVKDIQDLKSRINREKIQNVNLKKLDYYYKYLKNPKRIQAICKMCRARLYYFEEDQHFRLKNWQLLHKHVPKIKHESKSKQLAKKVREYQESGVSLSKQFIMRNLGCSGPTYYKVQRILNGTDKNMSFQDLAGQLSQKQYQIKFQPYSQNLSQYGLPELLILMSPQMRKQYEKYGKCLYLDTTYNLCKDKPDFDLDQQIMAFNSDPNNKIKKRLRQFALTCFFGLNGFQKIVIFAFAIVLNESFHTTYKILKTFLGFHKQIRTETIITDGGIEIEGAICKLIEEGQFKGIHLNDSFHFMKNLKLDAQKRKLVSEICKSETNQEYINLYTNLQSSVNQNQLLFVEELGQKSSLLCFSQIPKTFARSPSTSSPSQLLNDIIRTSIKHSETYSILVRRLCVIFLQINQNSSKLKKDQIAFEDIEGHEYLKTCRNYLDKQVFREVYRQIGKARLNYVSDGSDSSSDNRDETYVVIRYSCPGQKFYINKKDLTCSCGYKEKTMLPCNHLVSVAMMQHIDIFNLIGQFYKQGLNKINKQQRNDKVKTVPRLIRRSRPK